MLKTTDAKAHLFKTKSRLDQKGVEELIQSIESVATNISDRTSLHNEIWIKKVDLPLLRENLLPSENLKLVAIQAVTCPLKAAEAKKRSLEVVHHGMPPFAEGEWVVYSLHLAKKTGKAIYHFLIRFMPDHISIEAYLLPRALRRLCRQDPSAGREHMQFLINSCALPIDVKDSAEGYVLASGGEHRLEMRDCEPKDANPLGFVLLLSGRAMEHVEKTITTIVSSAELSIKEGSWLCRPGKVQAHNVDGFLDGFAQLGFSGPTVETTFLWTIKDYKHFYEMNMHAEQEHREASLSLLEFVFGEERKAQLDLIAIGRGKYRAYFSFDEEKDALELSRLLGIKLEKY